MMRRKSRGNTVLEFTLVGIPMLFILISIFEISRLVWSYHTLAAAVTESARFAIVHGKDCSKAPNDCAASVGDVARRLQARGVGLVPSDVNVTLSSSAGDVQCSLKDCLAKTEVWPPTSAGAAGMEIEISATYSMVSMVSMFWPGAGTVAPFGRVPLSASTREAIQF